MVIDPVAEFQGDVLIIAPHMDDEVLACGGTMALLPHKNAIHVVLATDGMKSPAPVVPGRDAITADLGCTRMEETRAALAHLGVSQNNIHFLALPEARLQAYKRELEERLSVLIDSVTPEAIFVPFRYDRHPDHLAVNHVVTALLQSGSIAKARLYEYFVYYKWRLLPARDVRRYIDAIHLLEVDTRTVRAQKREALALYRSQTTLFYTWQTRPILTATLLDEVSATPEYFLRYDPKFPGASVFRRSVLWIRLVHRIEPFLKKWRYLAGAFLRRALNHGL